MLEFNESQRTVKCQSSHTAMLRINDMEFGKIASIVMSHSMNAICLFISESTQIDRIYKPAVGALCIGCTYQL